MFLLDAELFITFFSLARMVLVTEVEVVNGTWVAPCL